MLNNVKTYISTFVSICLISLCSVTAATAAQAPEADTASVSGENSVYKIETGVPDYFCDEGSGQYPVLDPGGCYGTLYTYMDGRFIGKVNVLRLAADRKGNRGDVYAWANRWCQNNPILCSVPLAILSGVVDRLIFNGRYSR